MAARTVRGLIGADRFDYLWRTLGFSGCGVGGGSPEVRLIFPKIVRCLSLTDACSSPTLSTSAAGWADEVEKARRLLTDRELGLRTVALVGPEGVGKGPLARTILRSRAWKNVERLALTKPATAEEVMEQLDHGWDGRLIVITGLHWLVSLKPGGFIPIRALADWVIQDAGRNSWLLLADEPVWGLAGEVSALKEAFRTRSYSLPLDSVALEAAVLARHGLSGLCAELRASTHRV